MVVDVKSRFAILVDQFELQVAGCLDRAAILRWLGVMCVNESGGAKGEDGPANRYEFFHVFLQGHGRLEGRRHKARRSVSVLARFTDHAFDRFAPKQPDHERCQYGVQHSRTEQATENHHCHGVKDFFPRRIGGDQ
ncbi:hypothetical protein D3C72_1323420 [compost metagenome]